MSHSSELIAQDIEAYLKVHENKDLLRFLTCGNVDDGKSTLIGRLLFDSKLIYEDQMAAIEKDSQKFNTTDQAFDLALLVDGLQSEREQGITIDVAYRYFSTDKRKFIIADTPGHEQYTRNMATGASTCDLAIVMVDARHGIQTQTRRHSFICSLLGIKHVIVAINKMDLMDYSQEVYQKIKADGLPFADAETLAWLTDMGVDECVEASPSMPWIPAPKPPATPSLRGGNADAAIQPASARKDGLLRSARNDGHTVNEYPLFTGRIFSLTVASQIHERGEYIYFL